MVRRRRHVHRKQCSGASPASALSWYRLPWHHRHAPPLPSQAATKHPYARFGYAGAVLLGLLGWAIATEEKKHPHEPLGAHKRQQQHEGGGIGSK